MISYAQNFEDGMLERLFRDVQKGFYIDGGAADPINLSVTKWFYDKGCSGINVEPVREFHDRLVFARPHHINLNCSAGATRGEANFREDPLKKRLTFALNTKSSDAATPQDIRHAIVLIRTLNDIIEQYAVGVEARFLKIDVEGWEGNVLSGIDLHKYRPTFMVVEAADRNAIAQAERDRAKAELSAIRQRPIKHLTKFAHKNACCAAARLLGKT